MLTKQLHIYGQGAWHDDVYIVGTKDALNKLHFAIGKVLVSGFDKDDFFVSDGEGYRVLVKVVNESDMDIEPYTAECARRGDKRWGCDHFTIDELKMEVSDA